MFTRAEINSLSRLRAIPKGVFNSRVHLSRIRTLWDDMYRALEHAAVDTAKQRRALTQYMRYVDDMINDVSRFARTDSRYLAAAANNQDDVMRALLDAEMSRLLAGSNSPATRIASIIAGL